MSAPTPPHEPLVGDAVPEPAATRLAAPAAPAPAPGLTDLTHAFLANAQALEGVGALQLKLIQALERGDRSELVLANVKGLNEAFRGLTSVQQALLERLERLERPNAPVPSSPRAVPWLLLGLGGLLVVCTWALVGAIERHGASQPDPRTLTEHAAELLQSGREDAAREARAEAERLGALVRDGETRVLALQERLDEEREGSAQRQRELSAKEAEVEALKRQAAAAQNEALKMSSLEAEIRLLTQEGALVEPRLRGLERELEEQRQDNQLLRKRLASYELGYEPLPPAPALPVVPLQPVVPVQPVVPEKPVVPAAPAEQKRVAPPPTAPPAGAVSGTDEAGPPVTRDPSAVEQVRTTLNRLLDGARARRPDAWTLARVDGVAPDRLRGVVAQRLDSGGFVLETVEAREAFFWVDRASGRVKLELVEGVRTAAGQRPEPLQGRMEAVIAEGDAAQVFARSGLQVVRTR